MGDYFLRNNFWPSNSNSVFYSLCFAKGSTDRSKYCVAASIILIRHSVPTLVFRNGSKQLEHFGHFNDPTFLPDSQKMHSWLGDVGAAKTSRKNSFDLVTQGLISLSWSREPLCFETLRRNLPSVSIIITIIAMSLIVEMCEDSTVQ